MNAPTPASGGDNRGPRLSASLIMLGWILGSMALLLLFRGVPLRVRGLLILGSLLVMIGALGWMKLMRGRN